MSLALSLLKCFSLVTAFVLIVKCDTVEFLSKPSVRSAVRGEHVVFPCKVKNLDSSDRVAWVSPTSTRPLTMDRHTLSSNNHVIVAMDPIGGFQLHIHNVTSRDAGDYKCLVTTDPIMQQISVLHVKDVLPHRKKRSLKPLRMRRLQGRGTHLNTARSKRGTHPVSSPRKHL